MRILAAAIARAIVQLPWTPRTTGPRSTRGPIPGRCSRHSPCSRACRGTSSTRPSATSSGSVFPAGPCCSRPAIPPTPCTSSSAAASESTDRVASSSAASRRARPSARWASSCRGRARRRCARCAIPSSRHSRPPHSSACCSRTRRRSCVSRACPCSGSWTANGSTATPSRRALSRWCRSTQVSTCRCMPAGWSQPSPASGGRTSSEDNAPAATARSGSTSASRRASS
jgi:hypothetical protein